MSLGPVLRVHVELIVPLPFALGQSLLLSEDFLLPFLPLVLVPYIPTHLHELSLKLLYFLIDGYTAHT